VTPAEFKAFLKNAGNAYTSEKTDQGEAIRFRDHGYTFVGHAYESDPQLLHITCPCDLTKQRPSLKKLIAVCRDLEHEFPIGKLQPIGDAKNPGFEVSAEQLEADPEQIEDIFWRTIGLLRDLSAECYTRLERQNTRATDNIEEANGQSSWIDYMETALRNGCPGSDESHSSVSGRIRASLALVIAPDESVGSAFCVASSDALSYYLTNAHVVGDAAGVMLYRQVPEYAKMLGTVIAKGDVKSRDLAIVSVSVPSIPPVVLHSNPVHCESTVGLAGYPRAQIWAAETLGELMPAIHMGTITAVNKAGAAIVHDAVSRPGNSGGPLFDPSTGEVYGIQKSGWDDEEDSLAVGASVLRAFLEEHGVKLAAARV
jgi:S1-C subfamily serine protease